jgi:hypothetical protein
MTQLSQPLTLHNVPIQKLVGLLPPKLFGPFSTRSSPDVNIEVLSIRGRLQPGYSGAPILETGGKVVAVGSGGLADGFADVNWAIPIDVITWVKADQVGDQLRRLTTLPVDASFQILELTAGGVAQPRLSFLAELPNGKVPQVALPICELGRPPPGYRYIAPMVPKTTPQAGYNLRPGLFGPDGPMDFGGGNRIENPWGFEVKERPGVGKVFGQCADWGDPSGIDVTTSNDPIVSLVGYTDRDPRDVQAQVIMWGWFKGRSTDLPVSTALEYQLLGDSNWVTVKTSTVTPSGGTYSSKIGGSIPGFAKVRYRVIVPPQTVIQDHVSISDCRIINVRAHKDFLNASS